MTKLAKEKLSEARSFRSEATKTHRQEDGSS